VRWPSRLCAIVVTLALSTSLDASQKFDQPAPGARSPRNANYEIDVRLEPNDRTLHGRERIRWRNISAHPTGELQFHLYWNAWRNAESTWLRERRLGGNTTTPRPDAWGWTDIKALRVTLDRSYDLGSKVRFIAPDDGNTADRTVAAVSLPEPVAPNGTVDIDIEWSAKIPRPFARTGYIDDYYFFGQWFPKVGVLEDAGWNTHQFHSGTEFYSDYGVYDVRMTVPRGYIVGASGREVTSTDSSNGTVIHHYHGEDIHDFAWTTSPQFIVLTRTFTHPTLPQVQMRLLLRSDHAGQEARHFDAAAATLRYYGEWFGPYPYDNITIVDPAFQSGSAGMEYPTLFTAGTRWIAPARVLTPESVTVHEAGHQWWYGLVGSNEFEHAWMDEGINQFSEARVDEVAFGTKNFLARRYFGGFIPWVFRDIPVTRQVDEGLAGYRGQAESDAEATPSFRYWPSTGGNITYFKTALWLHTLEKWLGWPTLQRAMSTYFGAWTFRHPAPEEFFQILNQAAGRDLTPFFDQVYRGSNTFDYGVQLLTSTPAGTGFQTTVVVRRFGEAIFPVDVLTTFSDGSTHTERWDGVERRVIYRYDTKVRARSVEVDPKRVLMLDVNYTNNSRTLQPRAREASLKWSLKWMAWLQDVLVTYAWLV